MEPRVVALVAGAQVGLLLILVARRERSRQRRWMRLGAVLQHGGLRVLPAGAVRAATMVLPVPAHRDLVRAGLEARVTREFLAGAQLLLALAGLFLPVAAAALWPKLASPLFPLAGAAAGALGPRLWLDRAVRRRQAAVLQDLPGVIDLLAVCSVSGLNLTQSLQTVAAHQPGILGDELRQAVRLMQAGRAATSALRAMAERLRLPEVTSLANAVVLAEGLGTPVAELFRTQAEVFRLQQRRRAEETMGKLPMKFTLISVFLILPSLFILTVLPNVLAFAGTRW